jgi:hypothetical protein
MEQCFYYGCCGLLFTPNKLKHETHFKNRSHWCSCKLTGTGKIV